MVAHEEGGGAKMSRHEHSGTEGGTKNLRTVDLLEHLPHALDVVVIEEPRLAILVVLLERDTERVRDVHRRAVVLPKENAHDAFAGAARGRACMMVRYRKQDQWVYDYNNAYE